MGYYVYVYIYGIYHNDQCVHYCPTNPIMVVYKQKVQGYNSSVHKDRCLVWFSVHSRILKL